MHTHTKQLETQESGRSGCLWEVLGRNGAQDIFPMCNTLEFLNYSAVSTDVSLTFAPQTIYTLGLNMLCRFIILSPRRSETAGQQRFRRLPIVSSISHQITNLRHPLHGSLRSQTFPHTKTSILQANLSLCTSARCDPVFLLNDTLMILQSTLPKVLMPFAKGWGTKVPTHVDITFQSFPANADLCFH